MVLAYTIPIVKPLHVAARDGDFDKCKTLIEADPGIVSSKDDDGRSAMHVAAWHGKSEACRVLAETAPQLASTTDAYGRTPLYLAVAIPEKEDEAYADHYHSVIQVLADVAPHTVTMASVYGYTPLHMAAKKGNERACRLLLALAPETVRTVIDTYKATPLHLAARYSCNINVCRLLLEAAPDTVTMTDAPGRVPLHVAIESRDIEICRLLLEAAPQTSTATCRLRRTPLHLAARIAFDEICPVLVDAALETVNMTDIYGLTPMCFANDRTKKLIRACVAARLPTVSDEKRMQLGTTLSFENKQAIRQALLVLRRVSETLEYALPRDISFRIACMCVGCNHALSLFISCKRIYFL